MRINDLARELEVKSKEVLDYLVEIGIEGKRSHSSSLEDDQIDKVKAHFAGEKRRPRAAAPVEVEDEEPSEPSDAPPVAAPPPSVVHPVTPPPSVAHPAAPPMAHAPHAPEPHRATPPATPPVSHPISATPSVVGARPTTPPARVGVRPVLRPPMRTTPPPAPVQAAPPPVPVVVPPKPIAPVVPAPVAAPPSPPVAETPAPVVTPIAAAPPSAAPESAPPVSTTPEVIVEEPPKIAAPPPQSQLRRPPMSPSRFGSRPSLVQGVPAAGSVPPGTIIRRPDQVPHLNQPRPAPSSGPRPGSRPIYQPRSGAPSSPSVRPGQSTAPGARPGFQRPGSAPPSSAGAPGARTYERRPMHPTRARPTGPPGAGALPPPPGGPLPPGPSRGRPRPTSQQTRDKERPQGRRGGPTREPIAALQPREINRQITITEGITVKELAEKLGEKAKDLIQMMLTRRGIMANINQALESTVAIDIAKHFGAEASVVTFEEQEVTEVAEAENAADQVKRPPVVTIMGHVDHGKTSLLDAIRSTNVTASEAGGITQHIGAYKVEINGRQIVFIDTPGHEAFTRMRARGAKVTDIVVLVVAADDGVMPQTLEAMDHAKAAKVPIIVAVNKIDKEGAMPDRVKKQLADRGLMAEEWGGSTVTVEVSAKKRTNIELLLEMILLVADIQDLKANPKRPASGVVLEAKLDRGRGPVATVLVQNGTLHVGDPFIVGPVFAKVRALMDDRGRVVEEAGPSSPVEVLGLSSVPQAGDQFQVITDIIKAKQTANFREQRLREQQLAASSRVTLEQLHEQLKSGQMRELPIVLKADVQGSAEVLADSLQKIPSDKVKVKIIRAGVGAISESDVVLAMASNAVIIGFNVRPEHKAQTLAEHEKVDIRLHTIIYTVTDEVTKALTGLLEPTTKEVHLGRAEVRQTFRISKVGAVAGCFVSEGKLARNSDARLVRDGAVVYTGKIATLRRFKDEASEVRTGFECGVTLNNYSDMKPGDIIEAYMIEKVQATLTS